MESCIPKITSERAKDYIMSIRLHPDGLSFSGYCPTIRGSFFMVEEKWDESMANIERLKECFFANEWLSYSYKRVNILLTFGRFTIVPLALYLEEEAETLWAFNCGELNGKRILADEIHGDQANLLYAIDEPTYEFCARSFANPRFVHSMSVLLGLWKRRSERQLMRQVYVAVWMEGIYVACYEQGHLCFVNTYPSRSLNDMLFYVLYLWQQHGWNPVCDELWLTGDASVANELCQHIQLYIKRVKILEVPSEVYLMGSDTLRAPLDLIALSLT